VFAVLETDLIDVCYMPFKQMYNKVVDGSRLCTKKC